MRKSLAILALSIASVFAVHSAKADDSCKSVAGNLLAVSNCGFETGDFTDWSGTALTDPLSFSGVDSTDPFSGGDEAYLGNETGTDTLFQTLHTVAGTTYTISFAVHNADGTNPDANDPATFSAAFGSTTGFSESNVAIGPYVVETFTGVATGATTNLTFTFEDVLADFDLDSVSVVAQPSATPEPSSLMLLGTGVLGFAGVVRRRFNR